MPRDTESKKEIANKSVCEWIFKSLQEFLPYTYLEYIIIFVLLWFKFDQKFIPEDRIWYIREMTAVVNETNYINVCEFN